jgi:hypothetical protein
MVEILLGFTLMPRSVMMYPRSLLIGTQKVHFSGFNLMLKCLMLLKVSSRSVMRLLLYWDFTMMSLTKTFRLRPICPLKQKCIHRWYVAPGFFSPNGIFM